MKWHTKLNKGFWILIVVTILVLILLWNKEGVIAFLAFLGIK